MSTVVSPKPLLHQSVRIFVQHIDHFLEEDGDRQTLSSRLVLPSCVADLVLKKLLKSGKLSADNCLHIFPSDRASLTQLSLSDVRVSPEALRRLRNHELYKVEAKRLQGVNLSTLCLAFGERTMQFLSSLNVSGTSILSHNCPIMIALARLKNLVALNVSNTEFDTHCLELAARDLPNLLDLDISNTRVDSLECLPRLCPQLRAFRIYHSEIRYPEEILEPLSRMRELVLIDISDDYEIEVLSQRTADVDRMCSRSLWPNLRFINFSGNRFRLKTNDIIRFLAMNPRLSFIGLACWQPDDYGVLDELSQAVEAAGEMNSRLCPGSPPVVTALEKGIENIKEILRNFPERQGYVERALYKIYECTEGTSTTVDPELTRLILSVAKRYILKYSIALTACACLYNLTRHELGTKMPINLLNKSMAFVLRIMALFPMNTRLQKNCFLFLCSDFILHHARFNNLECCRLTLNALDVGNDEGVRRMGMAVVSILAAKISIRDLAVLAEEPRYMRRCLLCVAEKCLLHEDLVNLGVASEIPQDRQIMRGPALVDTTLRFTLSALWNLTDECPESCETFIKQHGLDIYVRLLERFYDTNEFTRVHIYTKCLGLLNNLAEVESLRPCLLRADLMRHLKNLMLFKHTQVGYFAAGIVAHLALLDDSVWSRLGPMDLEPHEAGSIRMAFLNRLQLAVSKWKTPQSDMVAYRSFRPFLAILRPNLQWEIYLWALWAMNHVCSRNPKRYMPLLRALPSMQDLIRNIAETAPAEEEAPEGCNLRELANNILCLMQKALACSEAEAAVLGAVEAMER